MGAAQTGTGKTAGFSLPIIQRLLPQANTSASPARHPVRALILTPTRELADQVDENVKDYASTPACARTVRVRRRGHEAADRCVRAGVEILVATPGRLLDHIEQKTVNLSQVEIFVLDEADRMLDMGFMPDIKRIMASAAGKQRQNLLFSATFSQRHQEARQRAPQQPGDSSKSRAATPPPRPSTRWSTRWQETKARRRGAHLARAQSRCIVLRANTRSAPRVSRASSSARACNGAAIHGDKTQNERMARAGRLQERRDRGCWSPPTLPRAASISTTCRCVINYDLPYNAGRLRAPHRPHRPRRRHRARRSRCAGQG
ncbi:MAG: DEAD/DEAH box helicase [Chthoniobacteraceae bacterium]